MPAKLIVGKNAAPAETVDVSFGGLYLRTDAPPPVRQLVKVALDLPPHGKTLTVMAMAVFVLPPSPGVRPGMGLRLFGLSPEDRERWEQFVRYVRTLPQPEPPPPTTDDPSPEALNDFGLLRPQLRIRMGSEAQLSSILSRELGKGRMYVRTPAAFEPGTPVDLIIEHPTTAQTFSILGAVDRRVDEPKFVGLRVLLPELKPPEREAFESFVGASEAVSVDVRFESPLE